MEFQAWPKIPRLFRDMIITEKIDGTNAAVVIEQCDEHWPQPLNALKIRSAIDGTFWLIGAQSRKRMITPQNDNYGFAAWVAANADDLVNDLGAGRHFGEWWGQGIQRRYGLDRKLFSLFNVSRYTEGFDTPDLRLVPVLHEGPFSEEMVRQTLQNLANTGSVAAWNEGVTFRDPEGIITFHTAANSVFKTTFDDTPKGE